MMLQPSRRDVLIGGAAALGLGLVGCSAGEIPVVGGLVRDPDQDVRDLSVSDEQALIAEYEAAIRTHPDLAARLEPILEHHSEHLSALTGTGTAPSPSQARPSATPGRAATLKRLRKAERSATRLRTDLAVAATGQDLALLLAQISCSERSHILLLAGDQ